MPNPAEEQVKNFEYTSNRPLIDNTNLYKRLTLYLKIHYLQEMI